MTTTESRSTLSEDAPASKGLQAPSFNTRTRRPRSDKAVAALKVRRSISSDDRASSIVKPEVPEESSVEVEVDFDFQKLSFGGDLLGRGSNESCDERQVGKEGFSFGSDRFRVNRSMVDDSGSHLKNGSISGGRVVTNKVAISDDARKVKASLNRIAVTGSSLGVRIAEMAGVLEVVSSSIDDQLAEVASLGDLAEGLSVRNSGVAHSADLARGLTQNLNSRISVTKSQVDDAVGEIKQLIKWVNATSEELVRLSDVAGGIGEFTTAISRIAQQTHILALNARIEAMRSGSAGASFAVIANSIRQLADQTIKAAAESANTANLLRERIDILSKDSGTAKDRAKRAEWATTSMADAISEIESSLEDADLTVSEIAVSASESATEMREFADGIGRLSKEVADSNKELFEGRELVASAQSASNFLVNQTVNSGVKTVDYFFAHLSFDIAREIAGLFERSIREGRISTSSLFDDNYLPIDGTLPTQYTTKYVNFTDQVLPAIQERVLEMDKRIIFCAAMDRNEYIGTHNHIYSKPQGDDVVWNAANSRNRRIFLDDVAKAAAANEDEHLIQLYRLDMGTGQFVISKDASSPIYVGGRHWGALRITYRA